MPGPWKVIGGLVLAFAFCLVPPAVGSDNELDLPMPKQESPKTSEGQSILPTSAVNGLGPAVPVSLIDVLKLASIANLDIAQANLVIERARANVTLAVSHFLPNVLMGSTYTEHEGTIQRIDGAVIKVNRDALFVGGGPSMTINFADALFYYPEARRRLDAAFSGQVRVTNDTLLAVANAYFNVLRARRQLARLDEVLDFLTSERDSELRAGSKGLLPLIKAFVESGTALPSDQARVEADVVRRMSERSRAAQDVRTASAELARLLHLSAAIFLLPCEDYRWPVPMQGGPWFHQPLDVLVYQGLSARPELAENASLIEAAFLRYKASKYRPFVPSLVVNFSAGGFGGGPPVVRTASGGVGLGSSGVIADFDQRHDLEVGLVWRLQGMGLGNYAQAWDNRVRVESRQVQQLFLQDVVVRDVVQALEQLQRAAERVTVIRASLFDDKNKPTGAVYRSLRLNFLRIKGGQGLPLEVLDSTRRLSDVLSEYANALSDYDQGRFRLLVALGMPPAGLVEPSRLPLPPGCDDPKAPAPRREPAANLPPPRPVEKGAEKNADRPGGIDKKEGEAPARPPLPTLPPPRRPDLPDDGLQVLTPARRSGP